MATFLVSFVKRDLHFSQVRPLWWADMNYMYKYISFPLDIKTKISCILLKISIGIYSWLSGAFFVQLSQKIQLLKIFCHVSEPVSC